MVKGYCEEAIQVLQFGWQADEWLSICLKNDYPQKSNYCSIQKCVFLIDQKIGKYKLKLESDIYIITYLTFSAGLLFI